MQHLFLLQKLAESHHRYEEAELNLHSRSQNHANHGLEEIARLKGTIAELQQELDDQASYAQSLQQVIWHIMCKTCCKVDVLQQDGREVSTPTLSVKQLPLIGKLLYDFCTHHHDPCSRSILFQTWCSRQPPGSCQGIHDDNRVEVRRRKLISTLASVIRTWTNKRIRIMVG